MLVHSLVMIWSISVAESSILQSIPSRLFDIRVLHAHCHLSLTVGFGGQVRKGKEATFCSSLGKGPVLLACCVGCQVGGHMAVVVH